MKTYKEFIEELDEARKTTVKGQEELELNETDIPKRVIYKPSDPNRLAHEEHEEITDYSQGLKSGGIAKEYAPHPAIQKAIHKLAHKPAFIAAMKNSTIKHIKPSSDKHVITNSDIGSGKEGMKDLDKSKQRRIQQQTNSSSGIDRPIVLSHHDKKTGITHTHLVAGNTRATHVGHGVEAHHITV